MLILYRQDGFLLVEKQTKILQPTAENIELCARALRAGELVAFPTETVYALGAAATDDRAVEKVFEVKGRSRDKALIVAVSDKSRVGDVVKRIPQKARMLMDRFMPGALTLVMDKADCIPSVTTAGGSSVAVRIPDNPVALKLIELAGCPVVVPSANTSDKAHACEPCFGRPRRAYSIRAGRRRVRNRYRVHGD